MFLLFFSNTSKPIPAEDNSPAIAAPSDITLFTNKVVISSEAEQLGINPINAVISGADAAVDLKILVRYSSPK